jgi:hypothetical protein
MIPGDSAAEAVITSGLYNFLYAPASSHMLSIALRSDDVVWQLKQRSDYGALAGTSTTTSS